MVEAARIHRSGKAPRHVETSDRRVSGLGKKSPRTEKSKNAEMQMNERPALSRKPDGKDIPLPPSEITPGGLYAPRI